MKVLRKMAAALCAVGMFAVSVPIQAAADDEKTPSGIAFSDVQKTAEDYANSSTNDYASFAAAVVTRDEILFAGAFGDADRASGYKADTDTVYEWGSVSKTMVWVSIMQLWEQGKLDLGTDIRSYLPDGFFRKLRYDDPITIRNLMNHSAGWGESTFSLQTADENDIPSLEQALRDTEPAQIFRPGETGSYSNWGAALAALIVERISGENYTDYVHAHILEPLGMEHTAVGPAHRDNEWVRTQREKLMCYARIGADTWISTGRQLLYIKLYPAGSVTGTIGDMAKYVQSFMQDPCPLFEKPDTRDVMLTGTHDIGSTSISSVCHGLMAEQHGNSVIYGHNGATNGCSANLQFDPKSGVGVALLQNCSGAVTTRFPNLFFGETSAKIPDGWKSNFAGGDISGVYFNMRSIWHGPLRMLSLINILPVSQTGENSYSAAGVASFELLGDGVLQFDQDNISMLGFAFDSAGSKFISLGAQSYKTDTWSLISLIALVLFALFAVIGVILLVIKLIARIAKKRGKYVGMGWMTLAQIMRVVSLAAVIAAFSIFSLQYGITKMQCYILCGVEAVCLLSFIIAALSSLRGMFTGNPERAGRFKYFANFAANGISVFAVIALELVRFWKI